MFVAQDLQPVDLGGQRRGDRRFLLPAPLRHQFAPRPRCRPAPPASAPATAGCGAPGRAPRYANAPASGRPIVAPGTASRQCSTRWKCSPMTNRPDCGQQVVDVRHAARRGCSRRAAFPGRRGRRAPLPSRSRTTRRAAWSCRDRRCGRPGRNRRRAGPGRRSSPLMRAPLACDPGGPSRRRARSRSSGVSTPNGANSTRAQAMRMPASSARSCSRLSRRSSGASGSETKCASAARRKA